jgi:hypothetical protein
MGTEALEASRDEHYGFENQKNESVEGKEECTGVL